MNILDKAKEIKLKLEADLEKVTSDSEWHNELNKKLSLVKRSLSALTHQELLYQFKDTQERINYFKNGKPYFFQLYMYYSRLLKWSIAIAFKEREDVIGFYKEKLPEIEQEYALDADIYYYFTSGESHFDSLYFIEEAHIRYDEMKGRMLALLELRQFLFTQLNSVSSTRLAMDLKWEGTRTELIELLYALYRGGLFGKATLKKVVALFGELFQQDLKNYAQLLLQIKMRKETSQTFFLNRLRSTMQEYLDKEI